jgi:hypothetical protein
MLTLWTPTSSAASTASAVASLLYEPVSTEGTEYRLAAVEEAVPIPVAEAAPKPPDPAEAVADPTEPR